MHACVVCVSPLVWQARTQVCGAVKHVRMGVVRFMRNTATCAVDWKDKTRQRKVEYVTVQEWKDNKACPSLVFIINASKVIVDLISQCTWLALGRCAVQPASTWAEQRVGLYVLLLDTSVVWVPKSAVLGRIIRSACVADLAQLLALWHTVALHSDNAAFVMEAVLWTSARLRQPEGPRGANHEAHAEHSQGQRRCHLRAWFRTAATLLL